MRAKPDPTASSQESVWAYPRPAIAKTTHSHVVFEHANTVVPDTRTSARALETIISGTALLAARLGAHIDMRGKIAAVVAERQR